MTRPIALADDADASIAVTIESVRRRGKIQERLEQEMLAPDWHEIARYHPTLYRQV